MQDGLTELNLNNNFGLFITLNPKTHEMQNGNCRLPAFLQSYFRPVACVAPDIELICAVSLYSDGFSQAQVSSTQSIPMNKTIQKIRLRFFPKFSDS